VCHIEKTVQCFEMQTIILQFDIRFPLAKVKTMISIWVRHDMPLERFGRWRDLEHIDKGFKFGDSTSELHFLVLLTSFFC
jgi:hypothetical protein